MCNIVEFLENVYVSEAEPKVKIPIEKGDLGLSVDDSLDDYKKQITSGSKKWEEQSQQINALVIFNKNNNPDLSKKWEDKRESLAKWIESKRKENPDFGK